MTRPDPDPEGVRAGPAAGLGLEAPEVVLDPAGDPGAAALGATGAEASVEVPWPVLLRNRVQSRATASPRYPWWVLAALLAGLLSLNFTFTVFVVSLTTVRAEFHTSYSVLTWTSTGPLLAFGLAAPVLGKVGDLFGHRRLYLLGLLGAMVSAVVTALAPTVGILLLGRALDGVQGAATGTASMAIILRLFSKEDRVKALGWWSMVGAGGPVAGVALGSPIIGALGWRGLFWVQLGLLAVSFCVVALVLPAHGRHSLEEAGEAPPGRFEGMDWVGSWALSAAVGGAMLALSVGPVAGWSSPGVTVPVALAVVGLVLFVYRERTARQPLIPLHYFRRRNFMLPMGTRTFTTFAYFGGFFLFPLLLEDVYGYTSVTQVGLISMARPICFSVCAPAAGYLAVRTGERLAAVAGATAVLASMVVFATLGPAPGLPVMVLALALSGAGMGVAQPATSSTQANEVAASEYGVMSAAQLLALQVGEVMGIQVLVTLVEQHASRKGLSAGAGLALLPSFHFAFWVGAAVALVGVGCALFIRDLPRGRAARSPA